MKYEQQQAQHEVPVIEQLDMNHWRIKWAGRCPFECDAATLTVIVRQMSPAAQRKLFQQLTHKEGV
jgi:hypothetical protein